MQRKFEDPELALLGNAAGDTDGADTAESLLRVYARASALKGLYRQGWLKRDVPAADCESVADHSFGTALLALLLAGKPPYADVDPDKAVRMALIHELGEVYAGDITPVDGVPAAEKQRRERDSLQRVLAGSSGAAALIALWEEFEEGRSPEARLLRRLDRLEMGLQAALFRARGFSGMEEFMASAEKTVDQGFLREILDTATGR